MSLRVTFEESNWVELPAAFPTADAAGPGEWIDGVVARMRESWPDGMDAATEREVREELVRGLDSVGPEDSATLQYWPWYEPVAAVLHLIDGVFEPGEDRPSHLIYGDALVAAPAIETVTTEGLGDGVEVRMLVRPEHLADDAAGLTQLYVSGDRYVGVLVDPVVPLLLSAMLDDLYVLMDTVRVLDEDGLPEWTGGRVADDAIPVAGEEWAAEVEGLPTA